VKNRMILVAAMLLITAACGGNSTGTLAVGDCLLEPDGEEITSFTTTDCTEPHDLEVYAVFESGALGYEAIEAEASTRCINSFATYVGVDYFDSELQYDWFQPTTETWDDGDRAVQCILYDAAQQRSESAEGLGR